MPDIEYQHGDIVGYNIGQQVVDRYQATTANCQLKPFDYTYTTNESIVLTNIDPSLGYFIQVSARTATVATFGPPSPCILLPVPPSVPASSLSSAAIGGIAGGVSAVLIIGLIVFLRNRRQVSAQLSMISNNPLYADLSRFLGLCSFIISCKSKPLFEFNFSNLDELQDLEIPRENVTLIRELGEGQFGKVLEAQAAGLPSDPDNTVTVAVKFLSAGSNPTDRAVFAEEAARMKPLHHLHVVNMLGVCFSSEPSFIILEFMPKGDLKNFLRNCRSTDEHPSLLTPFLQIEMSRQICEGISYLHSMNYVHRDIAARNILIDGNDILKVSDFGMARDVYSTEVRQQYYLTLKFILYQYYRKTGKGLLPLRLGFT